jgi:hypothetical protein
MRGRVAGSPRHSRQQCAQDGKHQDQYSVAFPDKHAPGLAFPELLGKIFLAKKSTTTYTDFLTEKRDSILNTPI